MSAVELSNQIGAGTLPANMEKRLVAEGAKFIGSFISESGDPILVSSVHADIHARWAEQMKRLRKQRSGLPSQYRIPAPVSIP
jgi:hypothetical protein